MARAIDADALWKEVEPYGLHKGCILGKHGGLADILMDIIEKQPTISLAKQEWISVKDRLPEKGKSVLVYWDDGFDIGEYVGGEVGDDIYWMPLPEPPEREK